jgi:hypothetical protein
MAAIAAEQLFFCAGRVREGASLLPNSKGLIAGAIFSGVY